MSRRGAFAGALLGGLAFWTLLEYVLHRWVFHFTPSPNSELSQDVHFLIHGVHHDWPHDPDRLVMPPVMSILLAVVLGYPIFLVVGPRFFDPFFAGLVVGYIWYDMTHYAVHHVKPRTEIGAKLRKHHYLHHFKTPEARYGVSTPLWDVVFGTLPREDRPRRRPHPRAPVPDVDVLTTDRRPDATDGSSLRPAAC